MLKNEKNYLLALNPNLRNLSEENIDRYAIDSLINENVKKLKLRKNTKYYKMKLLLKSY